MDLDHRADEDLAKTAVWSEDSLGYAREHGRRKLVRLLETVGAEDELEGELLALPPGEHLGSGRGKALHKEQRVADMATAVLARQAEARVERTGEPFEEALAAVPQTEAGRQLVELRDGPHRDEGAERWQEDLPRKRAKERKRARQEEDNRAREDAAWALFVRAEARERELRKGGQLAELLGEPLPGESPAALRRLASEDRRQAEEGLVALMSGGKIFYKHADELSQADRPARIAANRARTVWLKERRDGWLARGGGS
ncbi:MAG: hypothetical protein AVDCRST_MAG78-1138 [uncultured Rubrobacteraceae bacterium]|uniref:Uncharacterized protein n=1 Tax=uncultured Rubrobacteraceae bacterium TaxID=349277 RepID=A0A6J4PSW5_9ACTN|nr:MAG: hypothetical protein AVDCRST_MAG78-1138 [uncultured Rubrobacteraceae bacterium]